MQSAVLKHSVDKTFSEGCCFPLSFFYSWYKLIFWAGTKSDLRL